MIIATNNNIQSAHTLYYSYVRSRANTEHVILGADKKTLNDMGKVLDDTDRVRRNRRKRVFL